MTGRIPIFDIWPAVGCGRYPAKAVVGETFPVSATVFREGHDAVAANLVLSGPGGEKGPWTPMRPLGPGDSHIAPGVGGGTDRWVADCPAATTEGDWTYTVEGWSDVYATWSHDAEIKVNAGVDVELMLEEGARVLDRAAALKPRSKPGKKVLVDAAKALRDSGRPVQARLTAGLDEPVRAELRLLPLRDLITASDPMPLKVERERALYGSWYELFPRSEGAVRDAETGEWTSGTLRNAALRLPAIKKMGFDVVYLPPIHPVGEVNRKGPNNTLTPGPYDPGSPWAIGSAYGGHDAIHPDLGTIEDFDAFVAEATSNGIEVALDLALQCAPDHPWVKQHPEWFNVLADGSIAYAENPPKKYQDIYPMNFDNDPAGVHAEVLRVVRHWMDHGVRIFRVDNPHTKPVSFWEWLIAEVRTVDPGVIFLAEAFTKPPMMHGLAKVGFQQSYTYFTWRNSKHDLEAYLRELSGDGAAYLRPNLFVNTPDILHEYLQYGGPAAFKIRAAIAATVSPTWGVYSGYELYEHVALKPGSEEYLNTEKFEYRPRDYAAAEAAGQSLAPYLLKLNEVRRSYPALHHLRNLRLHVTDDDAILAYSKRRIMPDGSSSTVLVVVNVDPHAVREGTLSLDTAALGYGPDETFLVTDTLTGAEYEWGSSAYVRLDPWYEPAHIFVVSARA